MLKVSPTGKIKKTFGFIGRQHMTKGLNVKLEMCLHLHLHLVLQYVNHDKQLSLKKKKKSDVRID